MTVSIIIVSFNVRDDLARCLASLHDAPPRVGHDIVVVDNASADGSAAMVLRQFPRVRLIDAGGNLGFSRANNLGIRATTGSLVLLLNGDTIVPGGAIDTMVARFQAYPEVAIVGPKLVDAEGRAEISFGSMMTPFNELRQKWRMEHYARGSRGAVQWVSRMTSREHFPDWVSGACLLIERQALEQAGLLDERFFMYTEDVDLCATVRRMGRRALFTPAATVVHLRGRSVAAAGAAAPAGYRRSHLAFYAKHHPVWLPFLKLYLRLKGEFPPPPDTAMADTVSSGLRP
jgi:GT2 family glycosyltransferase